MKKLLFLVAIMLPVLAFASNIDPLYDFDYARAGVKGLYVTGGPDVNMDNAVYDKDGKKIDQPAGFKYSSMDIWVPIRLGYSFNEKYSAGVVVPIASLSHKTTAMTGAEEVTQANTGLGNPWVWGKGVFTTGSGFMIGPRLGVKIPALAYTMEDQIKDMIADPTADVKATTGDKSLAIDVAAVFAARPESNSFRLDGQLALRYSMEGKYSYDVEIPATPLTPAQTVTTEVAYTPGMMLDFRAMPGMAFGGNKNFEAYLWLEYAMMLTESTSTTTSGGTAAPEVKTKGGSMFSGGIKADYAFDPNNNLELKFLYDVMAAGTQTSDTSLDATPTPAGMSVGIGYFGYIPM
jgi:hypothetical protein